MAFRLNILHPFELNLALLLQSATSPSYRQQIISFLFFSSSRQKLTPAHNSDDIHLIYSTNQLCWLSYHLCYTQNSKLNRLTPFSWSFIEQKCQLVGKTTSSIEFGRYSGDLFNRELVLIVSTVVRYVKSKTESIDAVSNGYHRWKSLSLFCVDIIVLYGASKLVFVLFVVLQFFFLFFFTGFYFFFSGLK